MGCRHQRQALAVVFPANPCSRHQLLRDRPRRSASQAGPHAPEIAESFRYFWLLFRSDAFEPVQVEHQGKKRSLSLLDQLLLYSEDYAKELGERLKERIFEDIFPHLAAGFIAFMRQRDGAHTDISQETLNTVYQGTLTLLYRLLFLLYAESRDLLPVKDVRGYYEASLTKFKQAVAEAARGHPGRSRGETQKAPPGR